VRLSILSVLSVLSVFRQTLAQPLIPRQNTS
jgi:hypothetical protein